MSQTVEFRGGFRARPKAAADQRHHNSERSILPPHRGSVCARTAPVCKQIPAGTDASGPSAGECRHDCKNGGYQQPGPMLRLNASGADDAEHCEHGEHARQSEQNGCGAIHGGARKPSKRSAAFSIGLAAGLLVTDFIDGLAERADPRAKGTYRPGEVCVRFAEFRRALANLRV